MLTQGVAWRQLDALEAHTLLIDLILLLMGYIFAALWQVPAGLLAEGPHVDAVAAAAQAPASSGAWLPIKRAVTSLPEMRAPAQGRIDCAADVVNGAEDSPA